jgi:hypothetical protein
MVLAEALGLEADLMLDENEADGANPSSRRDGMGGRGGVAERRERLSAERGSKKGGAAGVRQAGAPSSSIPDRRVLAGAKPGSGKGDSIESETRYRRMHIDYASFVKGVGAPLQKAGSRYGQSGRDPFARTGAMQPAAAPPKAPKESSKGADKATKQKGRKATPNDDGGGGEAAPSAAPPTVVAISKK